ncbi:hypothetical protein Daci_3878 [Delftia acidovorans SPH-1]|uniref:RHS repeat protein n=1 Tax=Delftia acidovorans (strain DSM 14801 / SPH-1) TaxID=398578 RepID=A9BLM4_DELAS|nr:hypothetical protein Daci_3878 [Delftia acidovorans SPH-1]OLE92404.1 MAG: hypothetical protein AUI84_20315 [Delftia sp. 13_1_40CM_3_66_6]
MCKFVRPAPIIKLILTNSDRQRQASLWPVATTCAAATNTTRHGVTQATRYAYDPTGRCVAKSDAFCSIHYLWDGDLTVHSQRGTRQALYIYEPGSFVPLATIQGAGEEHSTYWYQCDQIGRHWITDEQGQGAWAAPRPTLGLLVVASHCGTEHLKNQSRLPEFLCCHTIPLQKANVLLKPIQLDT